MKYFTRTVPRLAAALPALLLPAFAASPAPAQQAPPKGGPITCSSPVKPGESAKAIRARFGAEAAIETLNGAEGESYKALVLYPKDKALRLVVTFSDDKLEKASSLAPGEEARGWTIAGLAIGASLAEVRQANGKPFRISGFEWDYGGFVTEWNGGALGKELEGGCALTLRFSTEDAKLPKSMVGDGVSIASDNPRLVKAAPKVSEISLGFP